MKTVNIDYTKTKIRKDEPLIKVTVKGYELYLQEGDDVSISTYPCELCGEHSNVTVYRDLYGPCGKKGGKVKWNEKVFEKES